MYIKFLIGSIIFAGICFGIGYRVCWLRMEKEAKELAIRFQRIDEDYDRLLRRYKAQAARLDRLLEERRIATPVRTPVRNDNWEDDGR